MSYQGSYDIGYQTQTAGTAIVDHVPGKKDAYTQLDWLNYLNAATAHIIYLMRPLASPGSPGWVTLTAAAAAAQAVINISADPGAYTGSRVSANAIAANDYVLLELDDGTLQRGIVSSVSGLAVTLGANLAYAAKKGARLWFYGIFSDTNPFDGKAHHGFGLTASVTTDLKREGGLAKSFRTDEPWIFYEANGTNAGFLNGIGVSYWGTGGGA